MNQVQATVRTSALAIWSLVLGILSLLCFSFVTGIPAIICGHMGWSKIKQSQGMLTGSGMALAGLILGYVGTVLTMIAIIGIIAAIAIPNFVSYRDRANCALAQEEAAMAMAAVSCHIANKDPATPPTLEDLASDADCAYVPYEGSAVEISGTMEQMKIVVIDSNDKCSLGGRYVVTLPESIGDGWQ